MQLYIVTFNHNLDAGNDDKFIYLDMTNAHTKYRECAALIGFPDLPENINEAF